MKRSKINQSIREMEAMLEKHKVELPPFCKWTPEEWKTKNHEYDEIRDNMLAGILQTVDWRISTR